MTQGSLRILLAAPIIAAGIAGLTLGFVFPLNSLTLDDWGVSRTAIGVQTMAAALATLAATPIVPWLLHRIGTRALLGVGFVMGAGAFAAYGLLTGYEAWFAIRFVHGVAFTFLFVASEAWILERAPPERRGLALGLYATAFAGMAGVGGIIIGIVGHTGPWPFVIGAAASGIGLLGLLAPGPGASPPPRGSASPIALWRRIAAAPFVFLAPLIMGAIETSKYNFIPLVARAAGHSDQIASFTIMAAGFGAALLQLPVGALADRIGARPTLMLCAGAGVIAPLLLGVVAHSPAGLLGAVLIYTGLVTGLYTVGLVLVAERFSGGLIASANAAFAIAYGSGQLAGPALAGVAMDQWGAGGLLATLAVLAGLYLAALSVQALRGAR